MKNTIYTLLIAVLFISFFSCEKDEIMSYEGGFAINFLEDSTNYSFLANDDPYYIQEIKVRISGDTTDYERYFNVSVISDDFSQASTDRYEIVDGIIPAGEIEGILKIKLFSIKELPDTTFAINLKIEDTETFKVGNIENSTFKLKWTNKVVVPSWGYFKYFMCRTASTSCYLAILKSTGMTKFGRSELTQIGMEGAKVMGIKFGDYVKKWNLEHPNKKLVHSDGSKQGEEIVPLYYSKHLYD